MLSPKEQLMIIIVMVALIMLFVKESEAKIVAFSCQTKGEDIIFATNLPEGQTSLTKVIEYDDAKFVVRILNVIFPASDAEITKTDKDGVCEFKQVKCRGTTE